MNKRLITVTFGCVLFCLFSSTVMAVAPAGDRGAKLSAADEAQQEFIKQLRREIAVQRVLARQLKLDCDTGRAIAGAPPSVQRHFLKRLQADNISSATLEALSKYPAVHRKYSTGSRNSVLRTARGRTCVSVVEECFKELDGLVAKAFSGENKEPALAAEVPGRLSDAPRGT